VSRILDGHGFRRRAWNLCLFVFLISCCGSTVLGQTLELSDSGTKFIPPISDDTSDGAAVAVALPDLPNDPAGAAKPPESSSRSAVNAWTPTATLATHPAYSEKFGFKAAFWQTFGENLFFHVWRVAFDPGMRWNLAHKPFVHDWLASYGGYNMKRWGDGDDFVVNDVGHPLEGAVFARTFLQNSPRSQVVIGKNSRYWTSRLKALAWSAVWSTQLEIGPLSETSFGNQGGFTYVPDCGTLTLCLNNPKYPKPPTNNTGWTDFVVTPLIGTAWVLGEDTIDKYIVSPVARNHRILGGRVLRSALEPSRSFAAIFAGKFPWDLPSPESNFMVGRQSHFPSELGDLKRPAIDHWEIGTQYSNISLPVISDSCSEAACRKNLSGLGVNFDYNFTRGVAFDSTLNFIPGQQGSSPMMEGLFGVRIGARYDHFGVFAKIRPGFIYYASAQPVQGETERGSLTRFATDLGGIVEYYPERNSTVRFDVGTTVVRYLTNHMDPHPYELGTLLSNQYYVTQGNFQISTSYVYRF
jgi:hypothetical protein